jgi:hypothetical protein
MADFRQLLNFWSIVTKSHTKVMWSSDGWKRSTLLQNGNPLRGQSYPPPLRFFLSKILATHSGQIYTTIDVGNTPLSPTHFLHIHHPGLSYPTTSIQPCKTAKTPNGKSRLSPRIFRIKFLFHFIYSLTTTHNNNPDLCLLLYPVLSPYLYHHFPSVSLLSLVPLCVGTHRNAHSTFLIF